MRFAMRPQSPQCANGWKSRSIQGLRPALQKRIGRGMSKIAQLYAHASQQIINLQGSNDLAATACDAVVCRLCLGLWRFIGIKSENAPSLKRELAISNQRLN